MSIKIEVTGGSIGEVADKLIAIGRSLQGAAATFNPVMPEIEAQEPVEKPKAKKPAKKAEPVEEPVGNEPAPVAEEPAPSTTAGTPTAAPAASASEPAAPALDFDKDVGPIVVEAVTTHGREPVVAILNQFGAERASEVPEGQWAELVEALKAL